jgi:hypothetical protein
MAKRARNPEILIKGIAFDVTDIHNIIIDDPKINHWNPEIVEFPLHIIYGYPSEKRVFMFHSQEERNKALYQIYN